MLDLSVALDSPTVIGSLNFLERNAPHAQSNFRALLLKN